MKKNDIMKLIGAVVAGAVCIGAASLPGYLDKKANGTELDLAALNAADYGVTSAFQRPDGSYVVEAVAAGVTSLLGFILMSPLLRFWRLRSLIRLRLRVSVLRSLILSSRRSLREWVLL